MYRLVPGMLVNLCVLNVFSKSFELECDTNFILQFKDLAKKKKKEGNFFCFVFLNDAKLHGNERK